MPGASERPLLLQQNAPEALPVTGVLQQAARRLCRAHSPSCLTCPANVGPEACVCIIQRLGN